MIIISFEFRHKTMVVFVFVVWRVWRVRWWCRSIRMSDDNACRRAGSQRAIRIRFVRSHWRLVWLLCGLKILLLLHWCGLRLLDDGWHRWRMMLVWQLVVLLIWMFERTFSIATTIFTFGHDMTEETVHKIRHTFTDWWGRSIFVWPLIDRWWRLRSIRSRIQRRRRRRRLNQSIFGVNMFRMPIKIGCACVRRGIATVIVAHLAQTISACRRLRRALEKFRHFRLFFLLFDLVGCFARAICYLRDSVVRVLRLILLFCCCCRCCGREWELSRVHAFDIFSLFDDFSLFFALWAVPFWIVFPALQFALSYAMHVRRFRFLLPCDCGLSSLISHWSCGVCIEFVFSFFSFHLRRFGPTKFITCSVTWHSLTLRNRYFRIAIQENEKTRTIPPIDGFRFVHRRALQTHCARMFSQFHLFWRLFSIHNILHLKINK